VLPKRWIVERTFGWVDQARRLAKDFETSTASSQAWFMLSLAFLLVPRSPRTTRQQRDFESGSYTASFPTQPSANQSCRSEPGEITSEIIHLSADMIPCRSEYNF
jgi:hypothetical protein